MEKGANINGKPGMRTGRTDLQTVSQDEHKKIVRLFLENGVDVEAALGDFNSRKALQTTTENRHFEIVRLHLGNDADANANPCPQEAEPFCTAQQRMSTLKFLSYFHHGTRIQAYMGYTSTTLKNAYYEISKLLKESIG